MYFEKGYVDRLKEKVCKGKKRSGIWGSEVFMAKTMGALMEEGIRMEVARKGKDKKTVVEMLRAIPQKKEREWGWARVDLMGELKEGRGVQEAMWATQTKKVEEGKGKPKYYGLSYSCYTMGRERMMPVPETLREDGMKAKETLMVEYRSVDSSDIYWGVYADVCAYEEGRLLVGRTRSATYAGAKLTQKVGQIKVPPVVQKGYPQVENLRSEVFEPKI